MKVMITSLSSITTGKYVVTTASGTQHLIDFDNGITIRYGAKGHEWNKPIRYDINGIEVVEDITQDGSAMSLRSLTGATVGDNMYMTGPGGEWRQTTTVQNIERADEKTDDDRAESGE